MRIARRGIGHLVDGDLSGGRLELADRAVAVAGVPDVAGGVVDDAVRLGFGFESVFLHLTGFRIEAADQADELPVPPNRSVGSLQRIARALAEGRHHPLLERHLDISWDEHRRAAGLWRKMRREVIGDRRRAVVRQLDHRADEIAPGRSGEARRSRDHVEPMTGIARRGHGLFAGSIGQLNRRAACHRLRLLGGRGNGEGHDRSEREDECRGTSHDYLPTVAWRRWDFLQRQYDTVGCGRSAAGPRQEDRQGGEQLLGLDLGVGSWQLTVDSRVDGWECQFRVVVSVSQLQLRPWTGNSTVKRQLSSANYQDA